MLFTTTRYDNNVDFRSILLNAINTSCFTTRKLWSNCSIKSQSTRLPHHVYPSQRVAHTNFLPLPLPWSGLMLSLMVCVLVNGPFLFLPDNAPRGSKELILNPVVVSRTENERCLIEPSINSLRVSIKIKQADEIEEILCHKFTRFLMQRSEQFLIMRRKATEVRNWWWWWWWWWWWCVYGGGVLSDWVQLVQSID